ncbi:hypothetical protein HWV62_43640 [Athelia sp. TMB]|nr:hypothetical protein HWV62_43640 [Athelia sp. TMB]
MAKFKCHRHDRSLSRPSHSSALQSCHAQGIVSPPPPTLSRDSGTYWNLLLTSDDLFGNPANIVGAKVVVVRTGFSTHTINMGMCYIELDVSYMGNTDGSGTLHVLGCGRTHSNIPNLFNLPLSLFINRD